MPEVMITKFFPPRTDYGIIERPRLIQLLSENPNRKLTLLSAPAGYGKSVLALQFVQAIPKPLVWYQLDGFDNDPAVFIQYLVVGIGRHYPEFGQEALNLIGQGNITTQIRLLVTSLINNLAKQTADRGLVLVIDDYHVVIETTIHDLLQQILEHLPPGIQVVIASRTVLPISLSRLKVAGELLAVGAEELRFTNWEIADFLTRKHKDHTEQMIAVLEDQTGGWPAALQLLSNSSLGIQGALPYQQTQDIYDYLATEVLENQPVDIREFLFASAVLEIVTPEYCDLLLGRNDSEQIINRLDKQQLFMSPLDGGSKTYRYHHLFREFLLERLGSKRLLLWRQVGKIAWQRGELDTAVEYLMMTGINEELISLLKEACQQAFYRGRWQTVNRWLKLFPEDQIVNNGWLSLFQARVDLFQRKIANAETWLSRASIYFSAELDRNGMAEYQLLKARALRSRGRYQESLQLLEEAYPYLQEHNPLRFDLPLEKASILLATGQFRTARNLLSEALHTFKLEKDDYAVANLLEGLGNTFFFLGDYSKALQCYKKSADLSPNRTLPSYYLQDNIANIYMNWGELDKALEYIERSIAIKEKLELTEALPCAYFQLASMYVERDDLNEAYDHYQKTIHLIKETGGESLLLTGSQIFLARCLCLQGKLLEAQISLDKVIEEVRLQSGFISGFILVPYYQICALVHIQTKKMAEAESLLLDAAAVAEDMGFSEGLIQSYAPLAHLNEIKGDRDTAIEYSRKALEIAARMNCIQPFVRSYDLFQSVLKFGLEKGFETNFVQRILIRLGNRSLTLLSELAFHPDSEVRLRVDLVLSQTPCPQSEALRKTLAHDTGPKIRELAFVVSKTAGSRAPSLKTTGIMLRFILLGTLRIFMGDTEITSINWRTGKARDLLVYLAHQGGPVSAERILADLWPDTPIEKINDIFHSTMYRLRQTLDKIGGQEFIQYGGKRYQLLPDSYTTDLQQFHNLLTLGLKNNQPLDQAAALQIEKAISLYRGDYLSDMDYPWIIPHQEHLKRLYLEANLKLDHFYLHHQEYAKAIINLGQLTEQNPLSEEIHCLLMKAYAGLGDRLAVSRQYQKLAVVLEEELGLEPNPETRKLYYKLCGTEG
ncbi:MAG TPA: tetratricopeptide repeat protein [Bacillota bacterium]|nr:tetratricopeptide repeat protein [Bacillota bacterium]